MGKVVVLAILACAALTGCATSEQIANRRQDELAARDASDDGTCRSYGATPGTQPYFNCRMTLNSQHGQEDAQKQQASDAANLMLLGTGLNMMSGGR